MRCPFQGGFEACRPPLRAAVTESKGKRLQSLPCGSLDTPPESDHVETYGAALWGKAVGSPPAQLPIREGLAMASWARWACHLSGLRLSVTQFFSSVRWAGSPHPGMLGDSREREQCQA